MEMLREIMKGWYLLLSQVSAAASIPVKEIAESGQLPLLSVFLLGFVAGMSPCQITTNLSALAYVFGRMNQRAVWRETMAYTLAKGLVYMSLGGTAIFVGFKVNEEAIPVVLWVRKAIGPLLLLIGLSLIGLIRLRGPIGGGRIAALRCCLPQGGIVGAFSLGLLFSFAFCPSLFWIFFGLMIPLALVSSGGWAFPGIFAIGTAVPLIVLGGILATGRELSAALSERLKRMQTKVSRFAGAVFIVTGVHDTLVYWFL
jgi:cytochrome c biogenesis protein CcdA